MLIKSDDQAIHAVRPGRRSSKRWKTKCFSLRCSMSSWAQCARGGDHGAGWGGCIFPTNPAWKSVWSHQRVAQGCLTPKKKTLGFFFDGLLQHPVACGPLTDWPDGLSAPNRKHEYICNLQCGCLGAALKGSWAREPCPCPEKSGWLVYFCFFPKYLPRRLI